MGKKWPGKKPYFDASMGLTELGGSRKKLPLLISGESDQDDRPLTFACTSQTELGSVKTLSVYESETTNMIMLVDLTGQSCIEKRM